MLNNNLVLDNNNIKNFNEKYIYIGTQTANKRRVELLNDRPTM